MTIAPISAAAFAYRPVAAPVVTPVEMPQRAAPVEQAKGDAAPQGNELSAAQIVMQANASAMAQAAMYDARVTGATETVTSFDRIAMVEKGFEHMRNIFEIANAGNEKGAEGGGAQAEQAGTIDKRV